MTAATIFDCSGSEIWKIGYIAGKRIPADIKKFTTVRKLNQQLSSRTFVIIAGQLRRIDFARHRENEIRQLF
jgi:hypothetical protein